MQSLRMIEDWPVPNAAAAVVRGADGALLGGHGPQQHLFPLASVTKLLTSYAVLVAVEEGSSSSTIRPAPRARPSGTCWRTPRGWPSTSTG